jgi:hypothetical protein
MPGFPDKFMPFMNQPPGSLLFERSNDSWASDSCAAPIHPGIFEQGTALEEADVAVASRREIQIGVSRL